MLCLPLSINDMYTMYLTTCIWFYMYTMKPRNGELAPIQTRFLHQVETPRVPKDGFLLKVGCSTAMLESQRVLAGISGTIRRSSWVAAIKYSWSLQSSLERIYPVQKLFVGWASHPERITRKSWSIENKYLKKGLLVAQKAFPILPVPHMIPRCAALAVRAEHGLISFPVSFGIFKELLDLRRSPNKNMSKPSVQCSTLLQHPFNRWLLWACAAVVRLMLAHAFPWPTATSCRVHGVDQRVLISRFITPAHCLSDSQWEMAQNQLDRRCEKWEENQERFKKEKQERFGDNCVKTKSMLSTNKGT